MSNQAADKTSTYLHGSSPEEQARLSMLNDLLNQECLRVLNPDSGNRVLDVGCGLGQLSRVVACSVGADGFVLGIERDTQQYLQAKKLAAEAKERNLPEFRQGDALQLPLDDCEWGTFDVAYCRFLLEHLQNPVIAISQMIKAVRPGGRVFLADDDHDYFHPWPEPAGFQALWQAYIGSYQRLGNDPFIGRRLVFLLREAGLNSIRNSSVFFGGCAGNETFEAVADNLIGVMVGAKELMLSGGLLDESSYHFGMDGLVQWKRNPASALWYSVCCAEGLVPLEEVSN